MFLWLTSKWHLERILVVFAGILNLVGLSIGFWISPFGYLLSVLVGANLAIFGITGFCPMAILLDLLGFESKYKRG
jgi:membrane associated rhomboid family serine protease